MTAMGVFGLFIVVVTGLAAVPLSILFRKSRGSGQGRQGWLRMGAGAIMGVVAVMLTLLSPPNNMAGFLTGLLPILVMSVLFVGMLIPWPENDFGYICNGVIWSFPDAPADSASADPSNPLYDPRIDPSAAEYEPRFDPAATEYDATYAPAGKQRWGYLVFLGAAVVFLVFGSITSVVASLMDDGEESHNASPSVTITTPAPKETTPPPQQSTDSKEPAEGAELILGCPVEDGTTFGEPDAASQNEDGDYSIPADPGWQRCVDGKWVTFNQPLTKVAMPRNGKSADYLYYEFTGGGQTYFVRAPR